MEILIKNKIIAESQDKFLLPLIGLANEHIQLGTMHDINSIVEEVSDSATSTTSIHDVEKVIEADAQNFKHEELLETFKTQVKEVAYKEGYEEGLKDVKEKFNDRLEKLDSLIDAIDDALPDYTQKSEHIIAAIVFEATCKIIGSALVDNLKVISVITHIIDQIDKDKIRDINISHNDFNLIENLKKDLNEDGLKLDTKFKDLTFRVDNTIKFSGCKINLVEGFLDASIDSQLSILAKNLKEKVATFS